MRVCVALVFTIGVIGVVGKPLPTRPKFAARTGAVAASQRLKAASPCRNGEIVFSSDAADDLTPQLFSIRLDGTGRRNVTRDLGSNYGAVWSPDGSEVAFYEQGVPGAA